MINGAQLGEAGVLHNQVVWKGLYKGQHLLEHLVLNIRRSQPWKDEESPFLVGKGPQVMDWHAQRTESQGVWATVDGGQW